MSINWNALRVWDGSQHAAFEELCCQLARHENIIQGKEFVRKGNPDAGLECYWRLETGDEWGWQAKYFTTKPETTQWRELDESISTAFRKHPKLKKIFICLPLDRADPRIEGQNWFMDKWIDRVASWKKKAQAAGIEVEFDYWGTSEIFERLATEEHRGRYLFWFNKELFSNDWFQARLEEAIANAGPRYSPEINVKLHISRKFDALGCTDEFINEIKSYCSDCLKQFNKLSKTQIKTIYPERYDNLSSSAGKIVEVRDNIDKVRSIPIDWSAFSNTLQEELNLVNTINNELYRLERDEKNAEESKSTNQVYNDEHYCLYQLRNRLDELVDLLSDYDVRVINLRTLLVLGDAGCGKTHLLCDVAERRLAENLPTILLLGGHFVNAEPWSQVIDRLSLKFSRDEFLSTLNTLGETKQRRILLIIDALNEGEGKEIWLDNLPSFIQNVQRYKWLCLVTSVRSTYETAIIPDQLDEKNLPRVYHYGFRDNEFEATSRFFDYYCIHRPSMPLLLPEFQNPLFLKLMCESIQARGEHTIPNGTEGLNSIFSFYIISVNSKLSKKKYLNLDEKSNIIGRAIDELTDAMVLANMYYLPRKEAMSICDKICHKEGYEQSLFRYLISEGVLGEDLAKENQTNWINIIRFSYEKFTDFMIVKRLIDLLYIKETGEFDKIELSLRYLKDDWTAWKHQGIVEFLLIQLPEVTGMELFELLPECKSYESVTMAFIDSFILRNAKLLNEKTNDFINENIMGSKEYTDRFINAVLLVSSFENHPYNAEWLHRILWDMMLPDRDSWWTIFLHEQYDDDEKSVNRLIKWALSEADKSYISEKSMELISIVLAWFLTSSNRYIRDKATKGLVNILTDRINIVIKLLERFYEVNDPYVIERLFAVAYGCILRSNNPQELESLAKYTYELVFNNNDEVYPNVLLRDYARGIIEFALKKGSIEGIAEIRIRPPYRSKLELEELTKNMFEKYKETEKFKSSEDWTMFHLYDSVLGFGDFARYVIGTNSTEKVFAKLKIDEPVPMSLREKFDEFEDSLDEVEQEAWKNLLTAVSTINIKGMFEDIMVDEEEEIETETETVSAEELEQNFVLAEETFVAKLDNEKKLNYEKYVKKYLEGENKEDIEYINLEFIQAWIFRKVLELGWCVERFGLIDNYIMSFNRGRAANKPERIGKKYQWIALYEVLARLTDNYRYIDPFDKTRQRYEGPWQLSYIRNIDPSCTLKRTFREYRSISLTIPLQYNSWQKNESAESWLKSTHDLPNEKLAIEVKNLDDTSSWLLLENHISWMEDTPLEQERYEVPTKELWYMIKSYIVKKEDAEIFYSWASQQNFMGRWMPESRDIFELFLGEFHWSPAYDFVVRNENEIWDEGDYNKLPCKVMVTAIDYLWENGVYDCSIDESVRITLPTREIAEKMGLVWNCKDYKYYNKEGKITFQDPSVYMEAPNSLLVRKEDFLKFLDENGYEVFWTLLGEKNILHTHHHNDFGRLEISGVYRYINGKVEGTRKTHFNDFRIR